MTIVTAAYSQHAYSHNRCALTEQHHLADNRSSRNNDQADYTYLTQLEYAGDVTFDQESSILRSHLSRPCLAVEEGW